jgi:hypothetical protein
VLEHDGVKYTVAEAEPQKVNVLRIELPAKEPAAAADAPTKS